MRRMAVASVAFLLSLAPLRAGAQSPAPHRDGIDDAARGAADGRAAGRARIVAGSFLLGSLAGAPVAPSIAAGLYFGPTAFAVGVVSVTSGVALNAALQPLAPREALSGRSEAYRAAFVANHDAELSRRRWRAFGAGAVTAGVITTALTIHLVTQPWDY